MLTVFYGNQVYGEYPDWQALHKEISPSMDVYNNAVIYDDTPATEWKYRFAGSPSVSVIVNWWRADRSPMLIDDVPAICKAWMLIL